MKKPRDSRGGLRQAGVEIAVLDPVFKFQLDCIARRDVDGLMDTYDPKATIVLSDHLSRAAGARGRANGRKEVHSLLDGYVGLDAPVEGVWEYLQGEDLILTRYRQRVHGQVRDGFTFYVLRDGKVWRQVSGLEGGPLGSRPRRIDPDSIHPVFARQAEGVASGDLEGLKDTFEPDASWLMAANKSWAARARGIASGHPEIGEFLDAYVALGARLVELEEYVQVDDTLFIRAIMEQDNVAEESFGVYVFSENDRISHMLSAC